MNFFYCLQKKQNKNNKLDNYFVNFVNFYLFIFSIHKFKYPKNRKKTNVMA